MKLFILNITDFILSRLCHQSTAKGLRLNWIRESVAHDMFPHVHDVHHIAEDTEDSESHKQ